MPMERRVVTFFMRVAFDEGCEPPKKAVWVKNCQMSAVVVPATVHKSRRQRVNCWDVLSRGNGGLDRAAETQAPVSTDCAGGDSVLAGNPA